MKYNFDNKNPLWHTHEGLVPRRGQKIIDGEIVNVYPDDDGRCWYYDKDGKVVFDGFIRLNIRNSVDIHVLRGVYDRLLFWEIHKMTATFFLYSIVLYLIGVLVGFMWGRSKR